LNLRFVLYKNKKHKEIPRDNADMSNEKEISRLKLMEFSNFTASKKKQAFYSGFIQTEKKGCMRPRRI